MLVQVRQPSDGGGAAAAGGGRRAARGRLQPVPAVQLHHLRQQHARHLQVSTVQYSTVQYSCTTSGSSMHAIYRSARTQESRYYSFSFPLESL